jgi:hypothetical protein
VPRLVTTISSSSTATSMSAIGGPTTQGSRIQRHFSTRHSSWRRGVNRPQGSDPKKGGENEVFPTHTGQIVLSPWNLIRSIRVLGGWGVLGVRARSRNQQIDGSLPGLPQPSKQDRKYRDLLASRWLVVVVTRSRLSARGRTYWTIRNEHGSLSQRERGRSANAPPQQPR